MSVVEIFEPVGALGRQLLAALFDPVLARLYALPVLRDDLARIHGWIISPPGTVRPFFPCYPSDTTFHRLAKWALGAHFL